MFVLNMSQFSGNIQRSTTNAANSGENEGIPVKLFIADSGRARHAYFAHRYAEQFTGAVSIISCLLCVENTCLVSKNSPPENQTPRATVTRLNTTVCKNTCKIPSSEDSLTMGGQLAEPITCLN